MRENERQGEKYNGVADLRGGWGGGKEEEDKDKKEILSQLPRHQHPPCLFNPSPSIINSIVHVFLHSILPFYNWLSSPRHLTYRSE